MNYQTLSPTDCAAEVLAEIVKCVGDDPALKLKIEGLLRQKVRLLYEHCAAIAEDYVAENDLDEKLTGLQVGDLIAEEIRRLADDRKGKRQQASLLV